MVCFLFVAQLISSSNLLFIQNINIKQFTIQFLQLENMQFYTPAKYENINDRIKRLNHQNHHTNSSLISQFPTEPSNYKKHVKMSSSIKDYISPSHYSDEHQLNQSSINKLKQQLDSSVRLQDTQIYKLNYKGKKHMDKSIVNNKSKQLLSFQDHSYLMDNIKQQRQNNPKAQVQINHKHNEDSPVQTIKIQDILESYNNYRQNKQKFMKTINKDIINKDDQSKYQVLEDCHEKIIQNHDSGQNCFLQIENTLEKATHENKMTKIQKFKQRIMQNQQKSQRYVKYMKTQEDQDWHQLKPIVVMERQKLTFKSKKINQNQNRQMLQGGSFCGMLSPRMPGKIIKNIDRNLPIKY